MREIFNAIFGADKVLRCAVVFAVAVLVATIARHIDAAVFLGLLSALLCGIGWEFILQRRGEAFDTWRILATIIGAVAATICNILLLIA